MSDYDYDPDDPGGLSETQRFAAYEGPDPFVLSLPLPPEDPPEVRTMTHLEKWHAGYALSPVPECPYPWCYFSSSDHRDGNAGAWKPADCEGCDGGEETIPELEGEL